MRSTETASSSWLLRALSCGGCAVAALWGFGLLVGSMMGPLRTLGQTAACGSNLLRVTRAFQMYADDYEDKYPLGASWMDATKPYLDRPDRLHCPSVSQGSDSRFGYAMNSDVSGKTRGKIADLEKTPLVFDSTNISANSADAFKSLPRPGRHRSRAAKGEPIRSGNNVGYASGKVHVRFDKR